ncbi:MAG: SGNH/GDSL hydrolase family protein [Segniliparus sp.]|uniref:SGNH/GDSL hydrolase family protein n=1 Tax=Segniliparus sp. TaxID=2804064 RepID=UPI003F369B9F
MVFRYVAVGDSHSEGVGDTPWPDGTPRGWTDRLAERLRELHGAVEYANLAVRGKKAREIRDGQLEAALKLSPDLATISAGFNDILRPKVDFEGLAETLDDLVGSLRRGGAVVLVPQAPDLSNLIPLAGYLRGRREQLNEIVVSAAARHGALAPYAPAGSVFEDPRAWSGDRLHLNALGHERYAWGAAEALGAVVEDGWADPLPGAVPSRGVLADLRWWGSFGGPWIGRRLRGRSSGDGRAAKRPVYSPV